MKMPTAMTSTPAPVVIFHAPFAETAFSSTLYTPMPLPGLAGHIVCVRTPAPVPSTITTLPLAAVVTVQTMRCR